MQFKDLTDYGIYRFDWVNREDIQNLVKNPVTKNRTVLVLKSGSIWKMYKITHISHQGYYKIIDWKSAGLTMESYIKGSDPRLIENPNLYSVYIGKLSATDINNLKSMKLLEDKKKKPAFGAFGTLNPDAGDVDKSIEFFNNAVSSDIGSEVQGLGESKEMVWTDVYAQFEEIVDENFPFVDEINDQVDALYAEHKGEPAWDEAYERWSTTVGVDDNDEEVVDDEIQEG